MASILCPKCKNPLEIPKPAPEKIFCLKCGASFRNQSYKPGDNGAGPSQHLASPAAAGAGAAHAVAEPRVAKSLAGDRKQPAERRSQSQQGRPDHGGRRCRGRRAARRHHLADDEGRFAQENRRQSQCQKRKTKKDDSTIIYGKKTPSSSPGTERIPLDPEVQEAVDKGVEFLRTQVPGGTKEEPGLKDMRHGAIALIGLAMLECGVPADDPDVERVVDITRKADPRTDNPNDIAPANFLLDRLNSSPSFSDKKLINTLGLRLVNGQRRPLDLCRYTVPILNSKQEEKLKEDIENKTFQRPYPPNPNDVHMSCSQFAALGLWTAKRHGIKQDNGFDPLKEGAEEALAKAAYQVREQQNHRPAPGITRLGPSKKALTRIPPHAAVSSHFVFGRLSKTNPSPFSRMSVPSLPSSTWEVIKNNKNPRAFHPDAHGSFYFLWALERTALILNLTRIGERLMPTARRARIGTNGVTRSYCVLE